MAISHRARENQSDEGINEEYDDDQFERDEVPEQASNKALRVGVHQSYEERDHHDSSSSPPR